MIERTVKVMASNITLGRSRDLYIRRRRTMVVLAGAGADGFELRVLCVLHLSRTVSCFSKQDN